MNPSVIYQDLSHQARRHPKKGLIDHSEVSFMDEGSRLQRMAGALASQVALSQAVQFPVDQWR
jgi:hypothetical protein